MTTTILCMSSFFKGNDFLKTCAELGCRVILLVREKVLGEPWAREACDEVFAMPSLFDREAVLNGVSYLARTRQIDRIAPMDDFDVEMAAALREHLRIPGMGETTARYFRDKLAMRERCSASGILGPAFVHALNDDALARFFDESEGPWLIKPRSEASAYGIRKLENRDEAWKVIQDLGDARSRHLIEHYVPGDVCHVDGVISDGEVLLACPSKYRRPLMDVAKEGGVFSTRTVLRGSDEGKELLKSHEEVVKAFGLRHGVTHMEFIRSRDDGKLYFLETAARVGGAHIYDLVEAATGINLWREWAKLEIGQGDSPYAPPPDAGAYAGLILALSKETQPDRTPFDAPEVVKFIDKPHHIGIVLRSSTPDRIEELLDGYEEIVAKDYLATMPEVAPIH